MASTAKCTEMFIGKVIEIVDSSNKSLIGLCGKVIDETRNTLILLPVDDVGGKNGDTEKMSRGKTRRIFKKTIIFKIRETGLIVVGKETAGRPEERLKGK